MKRINIALAIAAITFLSSCIKDNGNYSYKKGNDVIIKAASYSGVTGDTLTITATRTYSNPNDTADFDHAWYIDGKLVGAEPVLKYVCKDWGTRYGTYYMTDRKSGNVYSLSGTVFFVSVSAATMGGWHILYEKGGKSELGHVRYNSVADKYFDYQDLYKTNNNGEELGSTPIKIKDFAASSGRGMFVIQRGGQGCVELDSYTNQKKLVTSKSFIGGMPASFAPVDMAFYSSIADVMVNQDGDLYARFTNGSISFTVPFMSTPLTIKRGMKISDIWDSWSSGISNFSVMYDKLNKRLLRYKTNVFTTGGGITIDTVPPPPTTTPYPADYTSLQDFGNWEYIWGGTFNEITSSMDCAMLIKNPSDNQLYYETFNYIISPEKVTPKKRLLFPGNEFVTTASKYVAIKLRNYLFFTGGANNDKLYYYDAQSETIVKLYTQFTSKINVITSSDDGNQIAVGLEDGTFILYDISNATMISGIPKELHRFSGLGRVVDVIVNNGKIN